MMGHSFRITCVPQTLVLSNEKRLQGSEVDGVSVSGIRRHQRHEGPS